LDTIDVAFATQRDIVVTTTAWANANAVAEHTIMLMLSAMRRTTYYHKAVLEGRWDIVEFPELTAKAIGLIGFGRIGRLVASRLSGFTPNILVFDPYVSQEDIVRLGYRSCPLEELLASADVVSLHMPDAEGVHVIGRNELLLMKPSAFLINTARGALVDEEALYWALSNEIIAGAGLDVVQSEPCGADNRLLQLPNVVVTPHIAGGSRENHEEAGRICVSAVIDVLFNAKVPETAVNGTMVHVGEVLDERV
jgi:D-3-phosphoglycerate dehydrogenase